MKRSTKEAIFYGSILLSFAVAFTVACLLFRASWVNEPQEVARMAQGVDEYFIINIRYVKDPTGEEVYILDYSKNGEPMTIYFPNNEKLEKYIDRLGFIGKVEDL